MANRNIALHGTTLFLLVAFSTRTVGISTFPIGDRRTFALSAKRFTVKSPILAVSYDMRSFVVIVGVVDVVIELWVPTKGYYLNKEV